MRSGKSERIGEHDFEVFMKEDPGGGRKRLWVRCCHIAESGMHRGQQCTWTKRKDSRAIRVNNGNHRHTFDIRAYFQTEKDRINTCGMIMEKFLEFVVRGNISMRAATSATCVEFINACIGYGYSMAGMRRDGLGPEDRWNLTNRNALRSEIMKYSEKFKQNKLQFLKDRQTYVHMSIDASTIMHIKTLDVILTGSNGDRCESLLFKEIVLEKSDLATYKSEITVP